jgi:hypothetical protein
VLSALALACAALTAGALPSARAARYLPPSGKVFTGVTDKPVSAYVRAVGKHPAVYQEFVGWGQWLPGITDDARAARARLMMEISTAFGSTQRITPAGIARGHGDRWLVGLNQALAASHNITYVRPMAEMDNYNNPYCGFNADGSSRGASHSPAQFRRAWKRIALILRGGSVAHIDQVLARLRMPRLRGVSGQLPTPQVAMLWVPMVSGDPAIAANQPHAYWPGRRWVDWVGTDFYSKFPNFGGLSSFASHYRGFPFVFAEYAMWGADDPSFIHRLFGWIAHHRQTRMVVYNQGAMSSGPFRLSRYPQAAAALRKALSPSRFLAYAPEW